jgi:acyl-CoA synthetase (AMP-forming)/AMP-acid ligase II
MIRLFNRLARHYLRLNKPEDIEKVQWKTLKRKLKLFKNTGIGKRYKFSDIKSISDYQRMVPVHNYDSIKQYWNNTSNSNRKNRIVSYALTSGTTGERKLIPLTKKSFKDIQTAQRHATSILLSKKPDYKLLSKKLYALAGNSCIGQTDDGINYGMATGLNIRYLSPVLTHFILPRLNDSDCKDQDKKDAIIADIIRCNKIGAFVGIPGVFVEFLKNLQNILGKELYEEFSVNVDAFFSTGSNYRVYKDVIFKLLGKEILFVDVYASSEGYFGYESDSDDDCIELFTTLNFYEFIPFEEFKNGNHKNRYLINELESGVDYAVLITTSAGAFSYIIGDVLRCVDSENNKFRIVGRTQLTINFSGEKVSINDVEEVFIKVSEELDSAPQEFFVTAYFQDSRPVYHWFVEDNQMWRNYSVRDIERLLNSELRGVNIGYDTIFNLNLLSKCKLSYIKRDRIEEWYESINSDRGHRKLPRLIPDLKIVESIVGEGVINPE